MKSMKDSKELNVIMTFNIYNFFSSWSSSSSWLKKHPLWLSWYKYLLDYLVPDRKFKSSAASLGCVVSGVTQAREPELLYYQSNREN